MIKVLTFKKKANLSFQERRLIILKRRFDKYLFPSFKEFIKGYEPNHWKHCHKTETPWDEELDSWGKLLLKHNYFYYTSDGDWDNWGYRINLITEVLVITKGTWDNIWEEVYKYNRFTKKFEYSHTPKARYHL